MSRRRREQDTPEMDTGDDGLLHPEVVPEPIEIPEPKAKKSPGICPYCKTPYRPTLDGLHKDQCRRERV